jgi:hypothetical protein
MNWVHQLSHVQLAINAASGTSTSSSPFKIIHGQNVCLLPAVGVYSTSIPSADEYTLSLMKVQQEANKTLEFARACQTKVS